MSIALPRSKRSSAELPLKAGLIHTVCLLSEYELHPGRIRLHPKAKETHSNKLTPQGMELNSIPTSRPSCATLQPCYLMLVIPKCVIHEQGSNICSASDNIRTIIGRTEVYTYKNSSIQLTTPCLLVSFQSLLPRNKKLLAPTSPVGL